jgi:hypothetical protein
MIKNLSNGCGLNSFIIKDKTPVIQTILVIKPNANGAIHSCTAFAITAIGMVIASPMGTGVINKKTPISEGTKKVNKVRKSLRFAVFKLDIFSTCKNHKKSG